MNTKDPRNYIGLSCTKALKVNLIFMFHMKFTAVFSIINISLMYLSKESNLNLFIANITINYYSLK